MYRLRLESRAAKALNRLPAGAQKRVMDALAGLKANPRPAGCAKIRGEDASYRIRVGSYRVIYEVDDTAKLVIVWIIGHRRDVYSRR